MHHHVDIHVGSKIRQARKMLGLSQSLLGKALGLSFQQIQKYETGENRISASFLWILSKELKIPVVSFFDGLNNQPTHVGNSESPSGQTLAQEIELIKDQEERTHLKALIKSICKASWRAPTERS